MITFLITSVLLGVGLAMDAFSVSMANGLAEPDLSKKKTWAIGGTFGFFQYLMPMIGWVCVHYLVEFFSVAEKFIPWIALLLLCYIGGKMLFEGLEDGGEEEKREKLTPKMLFVQGIATAIDALSVGFTIEQYGFLEANISALIIAVVTLFLSLWGVKLGKTVGMKLSGRATILGGVILIGIGVKIFVEGVFPL